DSPLGVGEAARVTMDDRVIRDPRPERVVLGAVLRRRASSLLGLVCPSTGIGAGLARRGRGRANGSARDSAAAGRFREALELVGALVDRLEVALVLMALPCRCDIRMPLLAHPPPGKLH